MAEKLKQRADGRYQLNVYLGSKNGKKNYKTVYGSSQKDVKAKAKEIRSSLDKGIDILADNDTFENWAETWLQIKKASVSNSQYLSCRSYLRHLEPLYQAKITKIRPADIQRLFTTISASESAATGKTLSGKTLKEIKAAISQVFKLAINNRVLDYNPCDAVVLPRARSSEKRRALTDTEQSWIINTPHRAQIPAMIMMLAGLRRGEVIPLTWNDIDFKNSTISVNKAVEFINGQPQIKPTGKTKSSIRTINIPKLLSNFLSEEKKKAVSVLVCPSVDGQLLSDSGWKSLWNSYLKELNFKYGDFSCDLKQPKSKFQPGGVPMRIPNITAHWLRHTYATLLYLSGVDILTAKEQLGHADIQTTLNIYTHLDTIYKQKQVLKLDEYLVKANF